ncbi:MAG: T9SS type A sorting domain-containing protein [Bacteroidetes bacterium]|nr:T9SS type A sorting domain-containing protein [Bacteroidota bacterium]
MKKNVAIFVIVLMLININIDVFAQLHFRNYACPNNIYSLAEEGNFIWVGTKNGLYKRIKSTGQVVGYLSVDDGLANNAINSVKVDAQGNKWIGTEYGLSVFNEVTNTWINPPFLSTKDIRSIAIDLFGNKWLVSGEGVLYMYNGNTWKTFNSMNSPLPSSLLNTVAIDNLNNIWIGTWGKGVYELKNDTTTWVHLTMANGLCDSVVTSITVDIQGDKWFGTANGGMAKYNAYGFTTYNIGNSNIPSNHIHSTNFDGQGNIWLGTDVGAAKYNGVNFTSYPINAATQISEFVFAIIPDNTGNIWFGTDKSLGKYIGSIPMQTFVYTNSIVNSRVNGITRDKNGNIWFATAGGASSYNLANNFWINYTSAQGIIGDWATSVAVDTTGTVWIGTYGGLVKQGGTGFITVSNTVGSVYGVAVDKNTNFIWLATSSGVWKYNQAAAIWSNYTAPTIPSNMVKSIMIDQNSKVWIITYAGTIARYNGVNWQSYSTSNGLLDNFVYSMAIDPLGNVWCATYNGVNKFNGTNWVGTLLNLFAPNGFAFDNLGNKWIGRNGADLFKISPFNTAAFDNSKGLVSKLINTVYVDTLTNTKWIGTITGVSRANCTNLDPNFTTDTVCYPPVTQTHLVNTTLNTDSTNIFQWDIDNDNNYEFNSWNLNHIFPSFGIHPVKMRAVNDNCISSVTKDVVVGSMPIVNLTPNGTVNICQGNSLTLFGDLQNYYPAFNYTYTWNHNSAPSPYFVADSTGDYFVTVKNNTCTANSDTLHINQVIPYNNQQICMVTVDTLTGKNMILWEKTPGQGIEFYNIYKETAANVYQAIGNVHKSQPGFFIDVNSDASIKSDRYKIAIGDTCGNTSTLSPEHKTLHLTVSLGNNNQHNLIWENYEGFAFGKYYIYRGTQSGNLQVIDSIQSNITTYTDIANIPGSVSYLIVIQKADSCFIGDAKTQTTQTFNTSVSNMEEYKLIGVDEIGNPNFELKAFPNPFTKQTNISYSLSSNAKVKLEIYNILGEKVTTLVDDHQNAGNYKIEFSSENTQISSGVYYAKLEVNGFVKIKKLVELSKN